MNTPIQSSKAFTLTEIVIATPVVLIGMVMILTAIWMGLRMMACNVSVNLGDLNARTATDRLTSELHRAWTVPVLTGSLTIVSGSATFPAATGSSAGIGFLTPVAGPFALNASVSLASSNSVQVAGVTYGTLANMVGLHVFIPTITPAIDVRITAATPSPARGSQALSATCAYVTCALSSSIGAVIAVSDSNAVYLTSLDHYFVVVTNTNSGGMMYKCSDSDIYTGGTTQIIGKNITTQHPFSLPANLSNCVQVNLTTGNADYSNRMIGTANMSVSECIPIRNPVPDSAAK